jgi:hypothetical protein
MGAAEIRQRDHHTRVGDRLLERCEMDLSAVEAVGNKGGVL